MNLSERLNLSGKTALITGSSGGIGRAIALTLAQQGANVLIHTRDEREAGRQVVYEAAKTGVKADLILEDLSPAGAVGRIQEKVRQLQAQVDILILNASVQYRQNWLDLNEERFIQQITVNWQRSFELIQAFVPLMQRRGWGRILTIGSVQQLRPHPQMVAYAAAKAAQVNMVRNLALQLAPDGITVNNIAPGVILTARNREALTDEVYRRQVLGRIPLREFGHPDDCTGLATLLCSEAGRYITGQDMYVDGGMSL